MKQADTPKNALNKYMTVSPAEREPQIRTQTIEIRKNPKRLTDKLLNYTPTEHLRPKLAMAKPGTSKAQAPHNPGTRTRKLQSA